MNFRIITDSSSNVLALPGADYACVPMKISTTREYVDDETLDLDAMMEDLKNHKAKSGSSCPNVGEWLEAFGDAEHIFCVTITKHLSGSFNAARQAAAVYMQEHPERRVFVFDSLSAGPELMLMVEKILKCQAEGDDFDTTREKVLEYHNHLHTIFCLESLTNLARNGRVNPAVAKIASVLGIRVIGIADGGKISLVHKPRGPKKVVETLVAMLKERDFPEDGLLRISSCYAGEAVGNLQAAVREAFPQVRFHIEPTTALCSYYAENGGFILSFEGCFNELNDNSKF